MSRFFIDRPIFAWVLSIVIVISGLACVVSLPIAQYPPIVPPTIQVTVSYPGASAKTVSDAVGQPIEAQVNGVEGMIYMSSTCTNNGQYTLTVSFEVGTDIHTALMLVQTRVQLAQPQLPASVQKQGVNVKMQSPNILLAVNMISPDGRYDPLYLSNYAQINIFDELSRVPGVGLVNFLGQRQYSMRAWLDPQKLASLDLTASEVIDAISEQNVEVAAGNIGQQPVPQGQNVSAGAQHAGPTDDARAIRRDHRQGGRGRPLRPPPRRGQDRARLAEFRPELHAHDAHQRPRRQSGSQEVSVGRTGRVRLADGQRARRSAKA